MYACAARDRLRDREAARLANLVAFYGGKLYTEIMVKATYWLHSIIVETSGMIENARQARGTLDEKLLFVRPLRIQPRGNSACAVTPANAASEFEAHRLADPEQSSRLFP